VKGVVEAMGEACCKKSFCRFLPAEMPLCAKKDIFSLFTPAKARNKRMEWHDKF
jgi:hypothetical protein